MHCKDAYTLFKEALNCSVHVNITSKEVIWDVGGQCKVRRNVMRLWHLVQVDSWWNRQTDTQETYCWAHRQAGRQTGQVHGQHSVVWHQESERSWRTMPTQLLPGRFSGLSQTEVRRALVARGLASTQLSSFSPTCDFRGGSGRGKTLPRSSSGEPPQGVKRKRVRSQEEVDDNGAYERKQDRSFYHSAVILV